MDPLRSTSRGRVSATGQPTPDPSLDALVDRLIGQTTLHQPIEHDVVVTRYAGSWQMCPAAP